MIFTVGGENAVITFAVVTDGSGDEHLFSGKGLGAEDDLHLGRTISGARFEHPFDIAERS